MPLPSKDNLSTGSELLQMVAARSARGMPTWAFAAGVAALLFGIIGLAKTEGYWTSDISNAVYKQLVPHANEASHPMAGDPALQEWHGTRG